MAKVQRDQRSHRARDSDPSPEALVSHAACGVAYAPSAPCSFRVPFKTGHLGAALVSRAACGVAMLTLCGCFFPLRDFWCDSLRLASVRLKAGLSGPQAVKAEAFMRAKNGGPCSRQRRKTSGSGPHRAPLVFRPVTANPRSSALA